MSSISTYVNAAQAANAYDQASSVGNKNKTEATATNTTDKIAYKGKSIGEAKLSEKAMKYYEELKKKFGNMDFILVSEDMKEMAKAQAGSYANASKMVVLIDEAKIEKMAEDENYRKQYESVIANAAGKLSQMGSKLSSTGAAVKGYGIQVNDGGTSTLFAVLKKSSAAQKERIAKKQAENRAERKEKLKEAKKEKELERLHNKDKVPEDEFGKEEIKDTDTVIVTAATLDELIMKVQDQVQFFMSDNVQTEAEKTVGTHIDYKG